MKKFFWCHTFLYFACIAVLVAVYGLFHRKSLVLWPGEDVFPRIYTDVREGGSSTADFFDSDSAVAIAAVLSSGLYHPHADRVPPFDRRGKPFACRRGFFGHGFRCHHVPRKFRHRARPLYPDPSVSRPGDVSSLRPLRMDISANRFYTEKRLPLSLLRPSELWIDIHGLEQDGNLYADNVLQVSVETGKGALLGLPMEIEIKKLEFFGTNRVLAGICLSILILVTILYIRSMVKYGKKFANSKNSRRIACER